MCSEFHLKTLPVESKLWSLSVTVQLWNMQEHMGNLQQHTASEISITTMITHLTALRPTCLYQHIQTQGLVTQTAPGHITWHVSEIYYLVAIASNGCESQNVSEHRNEVNSLTRLHQHFVKQLLYKELTTFTLLPNIPHIINVFPYLTTFILYYIVYQGKIWFNRHIYKTYLYLQVFSRFIMWKSANQVCKLGG